MIWTFPSIMTSSIKSADATVESFLTTNSGVDPLTYRIPLTQLVQVGNANGWLPKCTVVYPMVGGTSTTCSYNLVNPATFQITFSGSWSFSSNGAKPDGSTSFGQTGLLPSTSLSLNDTHTSYYSRTSTALSSSCTEIGVSDSGGSAQELSLSTRRNTDKAISVIYTESAGVIINISNTDGSGFFMGSRVSSTDHRLFRNGSQLQIASGSNTGSLPGKQVYLGAFNLNGTANFFSDKECAFVTIGTGISSALALTMYNDIQNFQRALGRNV